MIKRREFITLLGGAAAAWPLGARAQQPGELRRIGVLVGLSEDDPEMQARLTALRQGLERFGWSEGRNISLVHRCGDFERMQVLAKELLALRPDVIFAHTSAAAAAFRGESQAMPIVF